MYKLLAFDLDGTLLTEEKTITQENLDVIHRLIEKGYTIVIATGRAYTSARELTKEIEDDLVYICNNGNVVRDSKDDSIIMSKTLDKEIAKKILKEGRKMNLSPTIHVNKYEEGYDAIIDSHNKYFTKNKKNNINGGMTEILLRVKQVDEFEDKDLEDILSMAYFGSVEETKEFYENMKDMYPGEYNTHLMENIMTAESLTEFMHPDGNKWATLKEYANSIGIDEKEIISFGDDNNDVEMIENAGLGVAMKNASDLIKEKADIITDYNNDDSGIAKKIKEIIDISK